MRWLFAYNLTILAVGEVVTRAITFVAFVHLARVLHPQMYGLVELTLAVMMALALVVDQGLGTLGTREIARRSADAEPLVAQIVSTQLVLALVVYVLLAVGVACFPVSVKLVLLLLGYGLSLFGMPFFQLTWLFQGRQEMTWVAIPQVLRWGVFAVFVLAAVRKPEHVFVLPAAELVAIFLAGAVNLAVYRRSGGLVSFRFRVGFSRRLLAESMPIGGSQLIWALRMYLPTILLGLIAGQTAVGFFGAAHRVVMVIQTMLATYFITLFPRMSKASHNSLDHLGKLLRGSLLLFVGPSLLLSLVITLTAPIVIGLIFGEQYLREETVDVLSVLIWVIPILALRRHGRDALITLARQRDELMCSFIGVVLLAASLPPFINAHGPVGAAWAMGISESVATGLTWWRFKCCVQSRVTEERILTARYE